MFWVKSDPGVARSAYLAGRLVPVSDVSHLFWGLKLRDTGVPTGGRSPSFPILGMLKLQQASLTGR